jgi:hypothetical protein
MRRQPPMTLHQFRRQARPRPGGHQFPARRRRDQRRCRGARLSAGGAAGSGTELREALARARFTAEQARVDDRSAEGIRAVSVRFSVSLSFCCLACLCPVFLFSLDRCRSARWKYTPLLRSFPWVARRHFHSLVGRTMPQNGRFALGRNHIWIVCSFLVPHTPYPSAVRLLSIDRVKPKSTSEVRVSSRVACAQGWLAHLRTGRHNLLLFAFSCIFKPSPLGGAVPWCSVDP